MDAAAPTVVYIPVCCAPKKAPCPTCGKMGKRVRSREREVRTIAYQKIAYLQITIGEYKARCKCCKTFRTSPAGVLPRAKYDCKVRQAVLNRIIDDGMNVEATLRSLQRDFLLDLSTGFVYDCLRDAVAELDMSVHREKVLKEFSGTLCVDELHLGRYTLLLATDPIRDMPVAFALIDDNDGAHMRRFLQNLKNHGLEPTVVVTDGSTLYPKLLAELWPSAEHQLCVFHVMQDLNAKILDAVKRMRRVRSRRGNRGRQTEAWTADQGPTAAAAEATADREGKGEIRFQASLPDRHASRKHERPRSAALGDNAQRPAGTASAAGFCRRIAAVVRQRPKRAPSLAPLASVAGECQVPGDPRTEGSVGAAGEGKVPQDDCLSAQSAGPARADQQSCGALQPKAALLGEGTLQVAAPAYAGALSRVGAGSLVEERVVDDAEPS